MGPYGEYPGGFNFEFHDSEPSDLYSEVIAPKTIKGEKAFIYKGRVRKPYMKHNALKPPVVNSILLPFLKENYPDLLDNKNELKTKYMLTSKYPRAEYVSVSKYANEWSPPLQYAWEGAKEMCSQAFSMMDKSPLLAVDDAIQWLDRQTSPGYPWSIKYQSKAPLLDTEWFKPWYMNWESRILRSEAEPWLWRCFIKDEVKKKDDVLNHNPRNILASPAHASTLGNRLFGPMNDRLTKQASMFRAPCYVGVTKFNRKWHRLALHVLHFPNRAHGDATRWDGSVMPPALEFVKQWRAACLTTDHMKGAVDYYYDNVLYSHIVGCEGDLFVKTIGQPSGQTNTLHDNTIIHVMYFFYHWCVEVCKDSRFEPTWHSFREHVHLVCMGDDVIWSWSNDVKLAMMGSSVAKTFASIGVTLKYNDGDDTNQTIDTLEFCSMHFKSCDGIYVPLMKREKMIASMFLKKQEVNPRVLLRRLLSIRIEVWWDEYLRDMCDKAIDYLLDKYTSQMSGKPSFQGGDDASLELILTLKWSAFLIRNHYLQSE